eukprot:Nk52_evm1s538 gene=Nk52_evmTU1s538
MRVCVDEEREGVGGGREQGGDVEFVFSRPSTPREEGEEGERRRGLQLSRTVSAAPHMGDLMGARQTGYALPECFTPLERIVLTANGNLQRVISAYYNSAVSVDIVYNRRVKETTGGGDKGLPAVYERQVTLHCREEQFCTATSKIILNTAELVRLVEEERIGLGQLFRHLRLLPTFYLLSAGRKD